MQRIRTQPRRNWQSAVEALGLTWHTHENGTPYWNEEAYYSFSADEVDELEAATNELHALCLRAVDFVIRGDRFADLGVPAIAVPLIRRSWEDRAPSLYGRFDLAYDGKMPPRCWSTTPTLQPVCSRPR
jgi:glutathionylspermidine synthase